MSSGLKVAHSISWEKEETILGNRRPSHGLPMYGQPGQPLQHSSILTLRNGENRLSLDGLLGYGQEGALLNVIALFM